MPPPPQKEIEKKSLKIIFTAHKKNHFVWFEACLYYPSKAFLYETIKESTCNPKYSLELNLLSPEVAVLLSGLEKRSQSAVHRSPPSIFVFFLFFYFFYQPVQSIKNGVGELHPVLYIICVRNVYCSATVY